MWTFGVLKANGLSMIQNRLPSNYALLTQYAVMAYNKSMKNGYHMADYIVLVSVSS